MKLNYLAWNNLIAKYFFNESKAGKEVLLYVNDEVLNAIGEPVGAGVDQFIESLKEGPDWTTRQGFCQKALQACENWRNKDLECPPYTGYLAFFVLAAVTDTGHAPHAYYPGFHKRLGEPPDAGMPPSFHRMWELWEDLEKWSREDKHEEWGRFVSRVRGEWVHVGLPRSQTVLSESERKYLPNLFESMGLDPTDTPSPDIIPKVLREYGQNIFEKRTLRLLDSSEAADVILRNALVDLVLDELESWDGSVPDRIAEEGTPRHLINTGLRLCMKLDPLAGDASIYTRFKSGRMFPEEGLQFKRRNDRRVWTCKELHQGWSTPLRDDGLKPPERLNGVLLDWNEGEQFVDEENGWRARLQPAEARVFRLGADGLPDWVESRRLDRGIEFLVACSSRLGEKIAAWGKESCSQFEQKKIAGLPSGWILFHGKNASRSCPGIDVLSVSAISRLHLAEGLKAGKGNSYFKFAPPKVIIENSDGSEAVSVNGIPLARLDAAAPLYALPVDLAAGIPLRIEATVNENRLSKVIRLEEFGIPASFDETPFRNPQGEACTNPASIHACGAIVNGNAQNPACPQSLPTYLSDRIVFIGEKPGEVRDWPGESLPEPWTPVWALAKSSRHRWEAHFCGTAGHLKKGHPSPQPACDRAGIKRWKEALWYNRKLTDPPPIKEVRVLWECYVRAANRA